MKLKPITRSAFFHLRALLAFALCIAGGLLALCAVRPLSAPLSEARLASQLRAADAKSVSPRSNLSAAPSKKTIASRGAAAKSMIGAAPGSPGASATTSPAGLQNNTIAAQQNQLGQTVYSISPSNFDISPPLTQLAQISLPEPTEEQRPELPLPPWRTPRSDRPDPVTQVAPAPSDLRRPAPAAPSTGFNFEAVAGTNGFPPDTNGSVGNDQYLETVNTRYQVWSLNRATHVATTILGPVNINTLWAGFGGPWWDPLESTCRHASLSIL